MFSTIPIPENFFLVVAIVAGAAIFTTGLVIWINDRQSITHKSFLFFSTSAAVWIIANYLSSFPAAVYPQGVAIWTTRFSILTATWYTLFLFQLLYVFPKRKVVFPPLYKFVIVPFAFFTAILTLTPFVFLDTKEPFDQTLPPIVEQGPGILIFGLFTIGLTAWGIGILLSKYRKTKQALLRTHLRYIFLGTIITFPSHIIFNFILPAAFENLHFIVLGATLTLPFTVFTAFAIIKHHLLNIRSVGTELFSFLTIGIFSVQLVLSQNTTEFFINFGLLLLVILFAFLLIRSTSREIDYRVQQKAYEELHKLDAMKSEFIMIASHQLRTPLSIIKGHVATALEGDYGKISKSMEKALNTMFTANERLISLVDSFLNISKMKSGEIELNPQKTDLKDLLDMLVQASRTRAEEKDLKIIWNSPSKPMPQLSVDQEKIQTVIEGILDNAIRYTKKGSITVRLKVSKGGELLISIADTGKGLTEEEIKNIFTSFQRGKTAQSLWTEGVGLSLYIAKQFVEAHGGRIWVESPGPDKGSTFFLELPLI